MWGFLQSLVARRIGHTVSGTNEIQASVDHSVPFLKYKNESLELIKTVMSLV